MKKGQVNLPIILGFIISVAFVWVFFFSIWYSENILNRDKFVATTTQVLQSETVRNAISDEVIDKVKAKRPILGSVSAPLLLPKIIGGVMDSELFASVYANTAEEIHLQLTSKDPPALTIEVKPAKNFLTNFLKADSSVVNSIPDQIDIIRKNQLPSLYKFSTYLTLFAPILFIIGLILLAVIWRRLRDNRTFILYLSLTFAASGLLVYFLIPAFGNMITAQASNGNIAIIISQIYMAFTDPISTFALDVLILGLIIGFIAKFLRRESLKSSLE